MQACTVCDRERNKTPKCSKNSLKCTVVSVVLTIKLLNLISNIFKMFTVDVISSGN